MSERVLLTTPTFPPFNSGLGNVVQQQAKCLNDNGWKVVVATHGVNRRTIKDSFTGATIETFHVSGADSIAQPIMGDKQSYVEFLKKSDFDIIILNAWQTWSTDLVFANIGKVSGKKLLYSHCISTNSIIGKPTLRSIIRYLAWRPYWWSLEKKMKLLDGIIFLDSHGCDARFDDAELAKRLQIKRFVIPNSISKSSIKALENQSRNFTERNGILTVGAFEWQKGHDFVLRAYANSILKNRVQLDICGQKFSSYSNELQNLASRLGLSPQFVHFHEGLSQDKLLDMYSEARLFIYGSHTECQPLVLLDAMGTGTPFISRATGSIPMMSGGVSVQSEQEATQAIDYYYENKDEWANLSQAGQTQAREKYSPDKVCSLLMTALTQIK
jgi:1,2-diacylglycerol 3-alpha-glucosyltransferase